MVIECSHGRIHVLKSMGGSVTFVHPSRLPLLRFPPPFTVQSLTCKYPSSVPCVVFLWIPFPSESEARVLGEMQIKNCWKQSLRVSERTRIPRRPEIKFLRVYRPRWLPPLHLMDTPVYSFIHSFIHSFFISGTRPIEHSKHKHAHTKITNLHKPTQY